MTLHRDITLGEVHVPYAFSYADATARGAASGFGAGDVGKLALQVDDSSLWLLTATTPTWAAVGGGGAVDSVNGQTGVVVLDPDDLDDSATTNKFTTAANLTKLAGIEALADVTDATNVEAAGAVMVADTTTAGYGFVVDEDAMTSDSATKLPTQQSVKAYVDAQVLATGTYTDEKARDAIGAALVAGTGITVTVNDPSDTITLATTITQYTDEMARDALGAALTAGAGITVTPNDVGDTIAIASTITQYTDEMARDALGTALTAGSGITITPNDGADTITIAASGAASTDSITNATQPPGWYAKTPGAAVMAAVGNITGHGTAGTVSSGDDDSGLWFGIATTSTINNEARAGCSSFVGARRARHSAVLAVLRLTDVADVRIWVGFMQGSLAASGTPTTPTTSFAAFRFDTGAGDTHWMAVTGDGTSVTATDTGVTPVASATPRMEIDLGAGNVVFKIDGTTVATNTTNLPSSSQDMAWRVSLVNLVASIKAIAYGTAIVFPTGR